MSLWYEGMKKNVGYFSNYFHRVPRCFSFKSESQREELSFPVDVGFVLV